MSGVVIISTNVTSRRHGISDYSCNGPNCSPAPAQCLESSPGIALYVGLGKIHAIDIFKWLPPSANSQIRGDLDH